MTRASTTLASSLGIRRGTASWKAIFGWGITVVLVGAAIYGLVLLSGGSKTQSAKTTNVPAVSASDHTTGKPDARVTLVEYADFQCPACGIYYPIMKQLHEKYADRVLFVYREFPLTQIHKNGDLAARAAEAAALQGKFWEMYDQLYTNQNSWAEQNNAQDLMESYAKTIGLDTARWKNDLASATVKDKIAGDVVGGDAARVDSTPSFFLNNVLLNTSPSVDALSSEIDKALATTATNSNANTNTAASVSNTNL